MSTWTTDESTGWIPIGEIVGWDRNPNRHPPAQVAQLAASFRRFGFVDPVVIARIEAEGVQELRAGHGRVEALAAILREQPDFVPLGAPGPGLVRALIHSFPTRVASDAYGVASDAYGLAANGLAALAEPDEDAIAQILRDLNGAGEPVEGLGFDDSLESLLEGLEEEGSGLEELGHDPANKRKGPITMQLHVLVPTDSTPIERAIARVVAANPGITRGQALATICREWLDG